MRQFDRRRGAAQHDMRVAPVKLRHIAGRKEQRHKGLRARGPNAPSCSQPDPPQSSTAAHDAAHCHRHRHIPRPEDIRTAAAQCAAALWAKAHHRATTHQDGRNPGPRLGPKPGPGLRLALVNRLSPILQIFANRSAIARTNGALASLRDSCNDRAKPLILSPSRSPRRLILPIVSTHSTPAAPAQKRDCCTTGVVSFGRCSTPSAGHFCTPFYRRVTVLAGAVVQGFRIGQVPQVSVSAL